MKRIALLYAVLFLRDHSLRADPLMLLAFVDAWVNSCNPDTEELAKECGIHAAHECAFPVEAVSISAEVWIEPEDLRD